MRVVLGRRAVLAIGMSMLTQNVSPGIAVDVFVFKLNWRSIDGLAFVNKLFGWRRQKEDCCKMFKYLFNVHIRFWDTAYMHRVFDALDSPSRVVRIGGVIIHRPWHWRAGTDRGPRYVLMYLLISGSLS